MTDRTHPDSGQIITSSEILLHDAKTALLYEELRAAIDGGHESMTHADALAEIAAIRAENVELRAQLDSIGAGGVSGPLMGQPQAMPDLSALTERGAKAWAGVDAQGLREGAASAGSEPVAPDGWLHENGLLYRLTDERHPRNRDEINVTMADGSRSIESRSRRALELLDRIRAARPSPPEGMVATDAMIEAGKKMLHNSNGRGAREKVERIFNAMIAAAPPTASAGSGKGSDG